MTEPKLSKKLHNILDRVVEEWSGLNLEVDREEEDRPPLIERLNAILEAAEGPKKDCAAPLAVLEHILDDAEVSIHQAMDEHFKKQPSADAGVEDLYNKLFAIMGNALYLGMLGAIKEEEKTQFEFYFWPGYDRLPASDGEVERTGIQTDNVKSGRGYSMTKEAVVESYTSCAASWWFDRTLRRFPETLGDFEPGGTHDWLQAGARCRLGSGRPLHALVVEMKQDGQKSVNCSTCPNHGVLTITFSGVDEGDVPEWGPNIARILNWREGKYIGGKLTNVKQQLLCTPPDDGSHDASSTDSPSCAYPCPPLTSLPSSSDGRGLCLWPYIGEQELVEDAKLAADQDIRARLYSIWLASCFWVKQEAEWEGLITQTFQGVADGGIKEHLQTVFRESESVKEQLGAFTHWCSIVLDQTIPVTVAHPESNMKGTSELGTCMFLTNCEIPANILRPLREWFELIYRDMRAVDAAMWLKKQLAAEESVLAAEESVLAVAHLQGLESKIKTLLNEVQGVHDIAIGINAAIFPGSIGLMGLHADLAPLFADKGRIYYSLEYTSPPESSQAGQTEGLKTGQTAFDGFKKILITYSENQDDDAYPALLDEVRDLKVYVSEGKCRHVDDASVEAFHSWRSREAAWETYVVLLAAKAVQMNQRFLLELMSVSPSLRDDEDNPKDEHLFYTLKGIMHRAYNAQGMLTIGQLLGISCEANSLRTSLDVLKVYYNKGEPTPTRVNIDELLGLSAEWWRGWDLPIIGGRQIRPVEVLGPLQKLLAVELDRTDRQDDWCTADEVWVSDCSTYMMVDIWCKGRLESRNLREGSTAKSSGLSGCVVSLCEALNVREPRWLASVHVVTKPNETTPQKIFSKLSEPKDPFSVETIQFAATQPGDGRVVERSRTVLRFRFDGVITRASELGARL